MSVYSESPAIITGRETTFLLYPSAHSFINIQYLGCAAPLVELVYFCYRVSLNHTLAALDNTEPTAMLFNIERRIEWWDNGE